ncbi:MAG: histidine phosphatase family protein [Candidatus Heimdallarchaeota archaeon]
MTNNVLFHLRHAETKYDEAVPVSQWALSEYGLKQAEALVQEEIFSKIDIIITSGETKAYQTATPIATALNLSISQFVELNELHRDKEEHLTNKEYRRYVNKTLSNIHDSVGLWESGISALNRFSKKIDEVEALYLNKNILVVTHGLVINLYFGKLLKSNHNLPYRWSLTTFCDYGIVKNGKVIQDIVQQL